MRHNHQIVPQWLIHLPNRLTIFRIGMVPILLILYPIGFKHLNLLCGFLFMIASITDFFDGYIARKYNVESKLGKVLDPVADKLLSAIGLLILTHAHLIPALMAGLLLGRDIAINGLRLMAMENKFVIEVNQYGKLKTLFQSFGIALLLLNTPLFSLPLKEIGMVALWVALVLSLYSGMQYFKIYLKMAGTASSQ